MIGISAHTTPPKERRPYSGSYALNPKFAWVKKEPTHKRATKIESFTENLEQHNTLKLRTQKERELAYFVVKQINKDQKDPPPLF